MSEHVYVRNVNEFIHGYQKSSQDTTWMPGIGDYLDVLIEQNDKIISLLQALNNQKEQNEVTKI